MVEEHSNPTEDEEAAAEHEGAVAESGYVPGSRRADAMPRRAGGRPRSERPVRRPWLWPRLAMGAAIVLVFLLLGVWPVIQGRLQAAEKLRQAEAMLAPATKTVARIDDTVNTQLSAQAEPSVPSVAAEILVARRELTTVVNLIDEAMPHLTKDERQRAETMKTAASSRLSMIKVAPRILMASVNAVQAKTLGDRAWRLTKDAARGEARAVRAYNAKTASKVESASVTMDTALLQLGEARRLYSQAASAFPDAGFERYVAYVDVCRSRARVLQGAAISWLDGDKAGSQVAYSQYRAAAAKANAALVALPPAPGNATGAGFRKVAGAAADTYERERKRAAQADRALKGT